MRIPWWKYLAAGVAVALSVAVMVVSADRYNERVARGAAGADVEFTPEPEEDPTVVVVLGDSYTSGSPMNEGCPTWITILDHQQGWVLRNDSEGATGYVNAKDDKLPFRPRLEEDLRHYYADLVILAGGLNDWMVDQRKVERAVRRSIRTVRAESPGTDVVLLSPFGGPSPRQEILTETANFRRIAKSEGVPFIDVSLLLADGELIGTDGLHPIPDGHQLLAGKIMASLTVLGLPRQHANAAQASARRSSATSR